jgi:hypothetical protein
MDSARYGDFAEVSQVQIGVDSEPRRCVRCLPVPQVDESPREFSLSGCNHPKANHPCDGSRLVEREHEFELAGFSADRPLPPSFTLQAG